MKKVNVLQLTFIITGIIAGISALQYFLETLATYLLFIINNSDSLTDSFNIGISLGIILSAGFKTLISWLLITQSGKLAILVADRAHFGAGLKVISKANDLLYILLITVSIFLMLANITPLLRGVFDFFRTKSSAGLRNLYENIRPTDWTTVILNILVPLIFLIFAKPIADYFTKNVTDGETTIEEPDDNNGILEPTQD